MLGLITLDGYRSNVGRIGDQAGAFSNLLAAILAQAILIAPNTISMPCLDSKLPIENLQLRGRIQVVTVVFLL